MSDSAGDVPERGTESRREHSRMSWGTRNVDHAARGETGAVAPPGPSFDCECTLSHPEFPLADVTREVPTVTVRLERTAVDSCSKLLVFSASGERFEAFERALEESETASNPLVIERSPDRRSYRVELTEEAPLVSAVLVRVGARVLEVSGSDGEWDVHARFHSRQAFSAFRRYCADNDVTFSLHRLSRVGADGDRESAGLTRVRRETLRVAAEAGYFDVPRGISQSDLADRLGISSSAVSQRLRRATRQLVETNLRTHEE